VDVQDENGESSTWQIVGEDEADIKEGRISFSSPIARALIGKESGEAVDVQTPGGLKRYEIVDVRYL
jgi:transcription elongation factor GreA